MSLSDPRTDLQIVIPSAGSTDVLRRTLPALHRSLQAAGLDSGCVTLVDDVPERAGVVEIAKQLGFRCVTGGGLGPGAARNLGTLESQSRWILFLDDDVESDAESLASLLNDLADPNPDWLALIGSLRPPTDSPEWLNWAYESGTITTASALLPRLVLEPFELTSALLVVERDLFERSGRFLESPSWGGEDTILGLALARHTDSAARVLRSPSLTGIHHYVPSWGEWLERRETSGRQLVRLLGQLSTEERPAVLSGYGLRGGFRTSLRMLLSRVPSRIWARARTPFLRRLAGAAMTARGYRLATERGEGHS